MKQNKGLAWAAAGTVLACATLWSAPALADANKPGHEWQAQKARPLVIGHRGGGSGYLPEHTLEAYALGIELGADYIEPDLVATKDGHLIARHEPNMIGTTNVKDLPQFAARKRTVMLDGVPETGFFASDFTLAEIRAAARRAAAVGERGHGLRRPVPDPDASTRSSSWSKRKSAEKGRTIGIYPETKHPTYHQNLGLALEDRLLDVLQRARLEPPRRAGVHPELRAGEPEVPAHARPACA